MVTPKEYSYLKKGSVQDTAYWSEDVEARSFDDNKVVVVLNRPSLSNTVNFKAGAEMKAKLALV